MGAGAICVRICRFFCCLRIWHTHVCITNRFDITSKGTSMSSRAVKCAPNRLDAVFWQLSPSDSMCPIDKGLRTFSLEISITQPSLALTVVPLIQTADCLMRSWLYQRGRTHRPRRAPLRVPPLSADRLGLHPAEESLRAALSGEQLFAPGGARQPEALLDMSLSHPGRLSRQLAGNTSCRFSTRWPPLTSATSASTPSAMAPRKPAPAAS